MKFVIKKEDLLDGINIVERATSAKALQPVLMNILIETVDKGSIKLVASDLDMTISTVVEAQVEEDGAITLPKNTFKEIVSKTAGKKLLTFEMAEGQTAVNISCQNSKFEIFGISASEFPKEVFELELNEDNCLNLELEPFTKAVNQAGFAAASAETSNILSAIVCDINDSVLEIASTDGNRLARSREKIDRKESTSKQLLIPAKALIEFIKMTSFIDEKFVKIYAEKSKVVMKTEKTVMISRLLEGQYPKYNQLIPKEAPKTAIVSVAQMINAIELASIMVDDKKSILKLSFADNEVVLKADTPDAGKSEQRVEIEYTAEPLTIAFNYKYLLEAMKNIDCEEVKIGLNTSLSATILQPNSDEDFVCLIMPVQLRD